MAERGIVVEAHLGVEHAQVTIIHHDQRVDLEHAHVGVDKGLVEDREQLGRIGLGIAIERQRRDDLGHVGIGDASSRVDIDADDLFRGRLGNCLNVHAAFGRDHERHAAALAVDQQRAVQLAGNVSAVFDIQAIDLLAGIAGLLGHQRVAQHLPGEGNYLVDGLGQAHAALGIWTQFLELALATATGVDLALDHIERAWQRLRCGRSIVRRKDRHARRNRRAIRLQQLFGLMFMDVHSKSPWMGKSLSGHGAPGPHRIISACAEISSQCPQTGNPRLRGDDTILVTPAWAQSSCRPRSALQPRRPICRTLFVRPS